MTESICRFFAVVSNKWHDIRSEIQFESIVLSEAICSYKANNRALIEIKKNIYSIISNGHTIKRFVKPDLLNRNEKGNNTPSSYVREPESW